MKIIEIFPDDYFESDQANHKVHQNGEVTVIEDSNPYIILAFGQTCYQTGTLCYFENGQLKQIPVDSLLE